MGRPLPEASPEETPKPNFVNPFEKPVEQKPTAVFKYEGPEGKMYDVIGGESDKSTVGEAKLKELGIDVPPSPESTGEKLTGEQLRAKALAARKPEALDISEGFGGSGHPDNPDYVSNVLSKAGKGKPGLSVEPQEGFQHVVYRDKSGEPIAVAKIVQDSTGKNMVQDLATDKSKGLLTGRAMKSVGDKLSELGATEPAGTISADAKNFLDKMKGSVSDKSAEELPKTKYTIENAPPDQRAKMMRGAHEPVDILFDNPLDRRIFGSGSISNRFKGTDASRIAGERLALESKNVASKLDISEQEARRHILDYNAKIRELGSVVDKNGGSITAPPFEDFVKSKTAEESLSLSDKATSKLQSLEDAARARIKQRGTFSGGRLLSGLPADDLADLGIIGATKIARGLVKFTDWSAEMLQNFGESIRPHLRDIFNAAKAKHEEFVGGAAKKLFNSMVEAKGASAEQQEINTAERAKRFAAVEKIPQEGVVGAAKSLATMRGEYEKVNPGEGMDLSEDESNMLFTAIKRANISTPEKIRANSALFSLFNGDRVPQPNELKVLDTVFGKHLKKVSGPGASGGYDIENAPKENSFEAAGEKLNKRPDDLLTKLANLSTKTTRTLFGAHLPGTAISFHGINEAVRNTIFGPNFITHPIQAAERLGTAAYYMTRPGAAQAFLDVNMGDLGKAIDEGGLKATTGDIGDSSFFKGDNALTKGINYFTNPKPLFGQVIPALKLKSYQRLLEDFEKRGVSHSNAAKAAGEATNNIFGGLNLQQLERNPNTQKLFRAAALAPDWLESNMRLGKGMFDSLKNPTNPKSRVYLSAMANFLGSYIAMNVLNAMNNDGKFSFQNDTGHEMDVAYGKDAMGRTRYISPYGTAMDMLRIPLEIGHAAVAGNYGKAFSDLRSRGSGPLQSFIDLVTNTDYAGRSLYDKTKYGKSIPGLEQGENIIGDVAGHFLPVGAESGINLYQGKISPEEFASRTSQMPMKYAYPSQRQGGLRLRKLAVTNKQ